jgi:hypothetical protein
MTKNPEWSENLCTALVLIKRLPVIEENPLSQMMILSLPADAPLSGIQTCIHSALLPLFNACISQSDSIDTKTGNG